MTRRFILLLTLFLLPVSAITAAEVAPGVFLIPGYFDPTTEPDGNTIVFDGRDGLVVVDTGRHPEHTQAIIDFAHQHNKKIVAVVNSHWHLDHIGGNPLIRKAFPGVRIYASSALEGAQKGFLADARRQLVDLIAKTPDPKAQEPFRAELGLIDAGPALAPDEIVTATTTKTLGGRKLVLHLETHAVTAGDIWLFDPATKTLVSGDLITLPVPFFDTACPDRWKASLDTLSKADFKIVIPGHGTPMNRKQFESYRTAYDHLVTCAESSRAKKECIDGWMTDAAEFIRNEDPKFVKGMLDYYIDNSLRGDSVGKYCGE